MRGAGEDGRMLGRGWVDWRDGGATGILYLGVDDPRDELLRPELEEEPLELPE